MEIYKGYVIREPDEPYNKEYPVEYYPIDDDDLSTVSVKTVEEAKRDIDELVGDE